MDGAVVLWGISLLGLREMEGSIGMVYKEAVILVAIIAFVLGCFCGMLIML